ncbi:MAG: DUF58 domain-containing protein [bacterium JZ-2024 1]
MNREKQRFFLSFRAGFLGSIAFFIMLLSIFGSGEETLLWLGCFMCAVLAISGFWAYRNQRGIRTHIHLPAGGVEGNKVYGFWEITNTSRFHRALIQLEGKFPFLDQPQTFAISHLPPEKSLRFTIQGTCKQRGIYREITGEIVSKDPLGLFLVKKTYRYSGQFTVYPRIIPMQHFPRIEAGHMLEPVGVLRSWEGAGQEFYSVRPMVPGDSLRRVHWLTSARKASLHLKQFFPETAGYFLVVVDPQADHHFGPPPRDTLETAVRIAASFCFYGLQSGGMGTVFLGSSLPFIPVGSGEAHLQTLLTQLADMKKEDEPFLPCLSHRLSFLAPFLSFVVYISPHLSQELVSLFSQFRQKIPRWMILFISPYEYARAGETDLLPPLVEVHRTIDLFQKLHIPVYTIYREEDITYLA